MLNVNVDKMEQINEKIFSYVTEIKNLLTRVENVKEGIEKDSYGLNTTQIKKKLNSICTAMEKEKNSMNVLGNKLESVSVKYQNMELAVLEQITEKKYKKVTKANNDVDKKEAKQSTKNTYKKSKLKDYSTTESKKAKNITGNKTNPTASGSTGTKSYPTSATGLRNYMANYMVQKWGLTKAQAAGILANIQCESGFSPTNAQDSYGYSGSDNSNYISKYAVRDGVGWGICQWTYYTRKQGLLDYAKSKGTNVGDLDTQLGYLYKELTTSYAGTFNKIKKSSSAAEVAKIFMVEFERPANQSSSAISGRQNTAKSILQAI